MALGFCPLVSLVVDDQAISPGEFSPREKASRELTRGRHRFGDLEGGGVGHRRDEEPRRQLGRRASEWRTLPPSGDWINHYPFLDHVFVHGVIEGT